MTPPDAAAPRSTTYARLMQEAAAALAAWDAERRALSPSAMLRDGLLPLHADGTMRGVATRFGSDRRAA